MSVDAEGPELQILKAVQALDEKLSRALTNQTQTLTRSIQALADRHSDSLLQQEKRNATFADRERVEKIAEYGHQHANYIQSLIFRTTENEKRLVMLDNEIQAFRDSVAQKTVGLLTGANGYLVTFITLVIVALIAAAVARVIR